MMPPFTKLLLSGLSNAKTVFISSMIAFIFYGRPEPGMRKFKTVSAI